MRFLSHSATQQLVAFCLVLYAANVIIVTGYMVYRRVGTAPPPSSMENTQVAETSIDLTLSNREMLDPSLQFAGLTCFFSS